MAFTIFGWKVSRVHSEKRFTADDRVVAFILMAMTDRINRLFSPHGYTVSVTETERYDYIKNGKVPYHIAVAAAEFRRRFLPDIHRLLVPDDSSADIVGQLLRQHRQAAALDAGMVERYNACTDSWQRSASGIPFFALFDYLPLHLDVDVNGDEAAERHRQLVWNFKYSPERVSPRKHVNALYEVVFPLAERLNGAFGELTQQLTLFCIPASDTESQWLRYREFTRMLCRLTGMDDAFTKVTLTADRTPKHLGGERTDNYILDGEWFQGRAVVVFDDVMTTGGSLDSAASKLQEAGAVVVAACFLGHTVKNDE